MRVERAIAKESTRKSERANRAERTIVNERATRAESTKAIERAERTRVKSPALTWEQKAALNRARFAHRGAYVPAPSYPGPKPGALSNKQSLNEPYRARAPVALSEPLYTREPSWTSEP